MSTLNRFIVAALLRLKAPEFDPLVGYLRAVHQKALEDMAAVGDHDQWKRLQGRAQVLKELLELVESSDKLAAKLDSRPQQPL